VKEIFMLLLIVVLSAGCGRKQLLQPGEVDKDKAVEYVEVDEDGSQKTPCL